MSEFYGLGAQGGDLLPHGREGFGSVLLDLTMHLLEVSDSLGERLELLLDGVVTLLQLARLFLLALLEALSGLLQEFVAAQLELVGRHGTKGFLQGFPVFLELFQLSTGGISLGTGGGQFLPGGPQGFLCSSESSRNPSIRCDGADQESYGGNQICLHGPGLPSIPPAGLLGA